MNISKVLPMVKDLDGFMSNLTGVTSALQIAFDSTLLALFLSAGPDARADAGLPPIGGPAGAGRPLGRGARAPVGPRLDQAPTRPRRIGRSSPSWRSAGRRDRSKSRPRHSSGSRRRSAGFQPRRRRDRADRRRAIESARHADESLRNGVASPGPDRGDPDRGVSHSPSSSMRSSAASSGRPRRSRRSRSPVAQRPTNARAAPLRNSSPGR